MVVRISRKYNTRIIKIIYKLKNNKKTLLYIHMANNNRKTNKKLYSDITKKKRCK